MRFPYGQNDDGIHKEVKQVVCNVCEESFIDSSDLTNHEKSHTEEKRYICRQCGKTFKYATCFEKQKVTHKGEKPYASIHLEKPSPNSIIVTVIKAVTLDKSPCKHCGENFTRSSYRNIHKEPHWRVALYM